MDGSIVPLVLAALIVGIAGTWFELRASIEPVSCPECAHCRDRAELRRLELLAAERRREELRDDRARCMGLDCRPPGDDDERSRARGHETDRRPD